MANRPNFFLVGAPRCGTTSMFTYLKQHPQVHLSILKEPHFFGSDLHVQPHFVRESELYASLFEGATTPIIGEGSVWYFYSENAAEEIAEASPEAKILVMLRNPVQMIDSLHRLFLETGNETETDLETALELEAARAEGQRLPTRCYHPMGLQYRFQATFYPKLKRYFQVFGPERVEVVLFEDFVSDPAGTFREVADFLEIDAEFVPEFDQAEAARKLRIPGLRQLKKTHPAIRAKMTPHAATLHKGARRAPMSQELEQRLAEEMRPDIESLEQLLGEDLSHWYRLAPVCL